MQKNPFVIFGVDEETVNQNELYTAYREIRAKYAEEMFSEGENGAQAARKVSEIDQAYADAKAILDARVSISGNGNIYAKTEEYIKAGNYDAAQNELDSITDRTAEWNYLQSVIYYKKGWYLDSKKQLEMAISKDPDNQKYKDALTKLEMKTGSGNTSGENQNTDGTFRSYSGERVSSTRNASACDCCSSLICADCCCECMGGDLIRCC